MYTIPERIIHNATVINMQVVQGRVGQETEFVEFTYSDMKGVVSYVAQHSHDDMWYVYRVEHIRKHRVSTLNSFIDFTSAVEFAYQACLTNMYN